MAPAGAGRTPRRRRAAAILLAAAALLGCAHAPETARQALCPESEVAGQCSSGGWSCKPDPKRGCDLCLCEHMVI